MIRIIHFTSWKGLGGGPSVVFNLVQGLKEQFRFQIFAPRGVFLKEYSEMGVEVRELGDKNLFQIIKEIKKILQREKPDIAHAHGTRAAFWLRLSVIGLRNKPKIIYTLHGFHLIRKNLLIRWLFLIWERFLNRWVDVLVCVSEADKNLVLKYRTIASEKIKVIRNGVDIEKFKMTPELVRKAREKLGLESKFVLCAIGRLEFPKDFFTTLKALKIVLSEIKRVKLLIVGDGSLRKSLEEKAKDLALNGQVEFLGFREDIVALMNVSDIIILSTNWEGLPIVPLESGACKKPIIASDVEGVRETIIDKKTGYLFKPYSAKDLAEKIIGLFKSRELREKMGEDALYFISKNFSKEKMVEKYQDLYQGLL
jgi:glycosyltransferase EpsD